MLFYKCKFLHIRKFVIIWCIPSRISWNIFVLIFRRYKTNYKSNTNDNETDYSPSQILCRFGHRHVVRMLLNCQPISHNFTIFTYLLMRLLFFNDRYNKMTMCVHVIVIFLLRIWRLFCIVSIKDIYNLHDVHFLPLLYSLFAIMPINLLHT